MQVARESVETGSDSAALSKDLLIYCWGLCTALSGHHRSEDGSVFPRLLADQPELAPVIEKLRQDHNVIEHLIGSLTNEMERGGTRESALRHLDGIAAVMETHFGYEERQLVTALDGIDEATLDLGDLLRPGS